MLLTIMMPCWRLLPPGEACKVLFLLVIASQVMAGVRRPTSMASHWRLSLPGGHALATCTTLPGRCLQQAQGGTVTCPLQRGAESYPWFSGMSNEVGTSSAACASGAVPRMEWCRRVSARLLTVCCAGGQARGGEEGDWRRGRRWQGCRSTGSEAAHEL